MDQEKIKKPFRKTFIGNLLILIGICILMYWVFFGSLSIITRHNDVQIVPNLVGMQIDTAVKILEKQGFEIKIDSIYDKTKSLHAVVDQQPENGSRVKSGRIIFLTVNKANPPMVTLPHLVGKSYRTIEQELKKLNLEMGDTTEVYDLAVGTVMAMKINGQEVKGGTKVPEGTVIDFVISKGLGDTKVNIPDLIGKTLPDAIKLIEESGLNYNLYVKGQISDSSKALIYEQFPESKNEYGEVQKVWIGDVLEISYMQNPTIEKKTYLKRDPVSDDSDIINISQNNTNNNPRPNNTNQHSNNSTNNSTNNSNTSDNNSSSNDNKKVRPKR